MGQANNLAVSDKWRRKLSESNLFDRLIKHLEGTLKPPLPAADINGILRLVSKILPDLQSIEVTSTININSLTRFELDAKLISLGKDPTAIWAAIDKPDSILAIESNQDDISDSGLINPVDKIESESD